MDSASGAVIEALFAMVVSFSVASGFALVANRQTRSVVGFIFPLVKPSASVKQTKTDGV